MAFGFEFSTPYVLTGPDGTRAVFNDDTDPDYVGFAFEISGLDSPDIRESATDVTQGDGGRHGAFFFGRRPVVISAEVRGSSVAERNERLNKIRLASLALREDCELKWTPSGHEEVFLDLRRQQPVRVVGGWVKQVQIPMVAEFVPIQSTTVYSDSVLFGATEPGAAELTINHGGDAFGYLLLRIAAASATLTDASFENSTTSAFVGFDAFTAANWASAYMHTGRFYRSGPTEVAADGYFNPLTSYWGLANGNNDVRALATGSVDASTALEAYWRNAWL